MSTTTTTTTTQSLKKQLKSTKVTDTSTITQEDSESDEETLDSDKENASINVVKPPKRKLLKSLHSPKNSLIITINNDSRRYTAFFYL